MPYQETYVNPCVKQVTVHTYGATVTITATAKFILILFLLAFPENLSYNVSIWRFFAYESLLFTLPKSEIS